MDEGRKRLLSGILLALILVLLIKVGGGLLFRLLLGAVIIVALYEFLKAFKVDGLYANSAYLFGFTLPFLVKEYPPYALVVIFIFLIFSLTILLRDIKREELSKFFVFNFGIFYIPLLLSYLVCLRVYFGESYLSENLVLFLLLVVWAGDTGALYAGRRFGKKKLAPSISPNKTVAGTVGGLASSVIAGIICKVFFVDFLSGFEILFFSLIIGITGQVGDLCESYLKRTLNIKESGCVIPGHGGMLDRIDSLLFAGPVFYYLLKLFGV